MAKTRFTEAAVASFIKAGVPEGKAYTAMRDGSGLVLRVLKSGKASWHFVYRPRGGGRAETQRWVSLGDASAMGVDKAKTAAEAYSGRIALGGDPRTEVREAARKAKATVSVTLDAYEAWIKGRRLAKVQTMMSSLRRGLSGLLRRDLAELERRDFVGAIEKIAEGGRVGAAKDFRKHLMSYLERMVSSGVIRANVLAGYRLAGLNRDEKADAEEAGRALSADEVAKVWAGAMETGGSFGRLVQMALATGLRRSELAALKWSWVDRASGRITVPAKAMKAGREHVVPITTTVAEILDATPRRGSDLVFPSDKVPGGATQLSGWSKLMPKLRTAADVKKSFSLHDLRRTYRSMLGELGVREEIAEVMIAHSRGDLVKRYAKSELWEQRRTAADLYDGWLRAAVSRTNGPGAANIVSIASQRPKRAKAKQPAAVA